MAFRRVSGLLATATLIAACAAFSSRVAAQGIAPDLKQGDRVEVKRLGRWVSATVLSVQPRTNWVKVRLDKVEFPIEEIPQQFREQMMTETFPPDDVRIAQQDQKAPSRTGTAERPQHGRPGNADPPRNSRSSKVEPARKWTDRTGRFNIDASYSGLERGKAALIKADGTKILVPFGKLSQEDQTYIRTLFDPPENPFNGP